MFDTPAYTMSSAYLSPVSAAHHTLISTGDQIVAQLLDNRGGLLRLHWILVNGHDHG